MSLISTIRGQNLKLLTSSQTFSILPIYLAQLKSINNSENFENEIKQLMHFLWTAKIAKQANLTDLDQI